MMLILILIASVIAENSLYKTFVLPRSHSHWIRQVINNPHAETTTIPMTEAANICSSCIDREVKRNYTFNKLKSDILKKLNMSHGIPQVSRKDVSDYIVQTILGKHDTHGTGVDPHGSVQNDENVNECNREDNAFELKEVTIIAKNTPPYFFDSISQKRDIQYFALDYLLPKENFKMQQATLFVHVPSKNITLLNNTFTNNQHGSKNQSENVFYDHGYHVQVYLYFVVIDKHTRQASLKPIVMRKKKLLDNRGGWIKIDILHTLQKCLNYPSENLGVHILIENKLGQVVPVKALNQKPTEPFLQIQVEKVICSNQRNRRHIIKTCKEPEDVKYKKCCLWEDKVDFEVDLGWDWIIYPPKLKVGYCNGECDEEDLLQIPSYARFIQQASKFGVNPLCCTPRKMSDLHILYLDYNKNVILGKLPDMKVDKCGCA
jgi:hypothetical protein